MSARPRVTGGPGEGALKVLQLLSNPMLGGTETFVLGLTPRLRVRGLDIGLANVWDGGGALARAARQLGIPCDVLDVGQRRFRPDALPVLRAMLRREKFDVVTAYGLRTTLLLRAAMIGGGFDPRPVLVTGLRGMDDWRRWYHVWADRLTEPWMDYFVGVSRRVCRRRVEREGTDPAKVLHIPNGIDTGVFRRDERPWPARGDLNLPGGRLCVTVANLRHQKGHPFQLDVIKRLQNRPADLRFVWVGTGPDEPALRRLAAEHGLSDVIVFYGAADDVRPILTHAELFFLSSKEEGMPRAMMEAMAMGVPVLATDVGGNPEVVRDGLDGLIVPYGDVEKAAEALQRLVDEAPLRQRLAEAAACRIRDEFSFDAIAGRYADLYRRLAARDPTVSRDFGFA